MQIHTRSGYICYQVMRKRCDSAQKLISYSISYAIFAVINVNYFSSLLPVTPPDNNWS